MTQIFFYHGASDRLAAAASLINKAWAQRKTFVIYAPDAPLARAIDQLLWTGEAGSFIPHVELASPLAAETPILLADRLDALPPDSGEGSRHDRLLNLSNEVPPHFSRFLSLIEVVSEAPEVRQPARERFRFYRERGYAVQSFDLAKRA